MENTNSDLVFNVAQLLKEPVGSIRKLEISTPGLTLSEDERGMEDAGRIEAHDVSGNIKVTRILQDLLVQGRVEANVTLECSRCLEEFTIPVESTLEEKFQPSVDVETGRPVRREADEDDDTAF